MTCTRRSHASRPSPQGSYASDPSERHATCAPRESFSLSNQDLQNTRTPTEASATILIVTHEDTVRSVTKRILERRKFRIREARDIDEALAAFHECPDEIRGAVLDLALPGGGAEALAGEMRRFRPLFPILFTGNHTEAASSMWVRPDPANDYLAKPFGLETLAAKAEHLFGDQLVAGGGDWGSA